jgi:hypothetical protein
VTFNKEYLDIALRNLKNSKATGPDRLPGEFFKYGGERLQSAILKLFCKIKLSEIIPKDWYEGLVKPIHKEGSRESLSNYRGITISCVIYKVLVSIIERQTMMYLEEKNILGDCQGAFRKHRRPEDHIFALKGICALRKSKKLKTYLAYLDVSKAFDTISRPRLFSHIWNKGIQGKAWRLIRMLYQNVDNKVIFGNFQSDNYEVLNGVKQGCILSPCLFNLAMTDLQCMLKECEGISIGGTQLQGLFYADDIVLIGNSDTDLTRMLGTANSFSQKWGLRFNCKKSQIMVIGRRMSSKLWPLGSMMLPETKNYKYLGVIINSNLSDTDHINSHLAKKAKKLQGYLRYTLSGHMDINRVNFGNTLWQKAVLPSLSHGTAVWFNNSISTRKNLQSFQYNCARAVLKLHSTPARLALVAELGWMPITDHLDALRISYFDHLRKMDNNRLTKIVFEEMSHLSNDYVGKFNYHQNIKSILVDRGLDHMFVNQDMLDTARFKNTAKALYLDTFTNDINSLSSLNLFRFLKTDVNRSEYLANEKYSFHARQLKFKLRTGVLGLGADLSRQHRGSGLCKICGNFETAKHFIFLCPAYSKLRQVMINDIKSCVGSQIFDCFIQDMDFAVSAVLGDHDDYFNQHFLRFVGKAWTLRNEHL